MSIDEDISQINDYTQFTDFEELTTRLELFLRQSGYSSDIRQVTGSPPANLFQFRGFCFSLQRRGEKSSRLTMLEPACVHDMWDDSSSFYPFLNHKLTDIFGVRESLAAISEDSPKVADKSVLSALAVGALNAKCALPVFVQTNEHQGIVPVVIRGLLLSPGFHANFEVFDLDANWKIDPELQFVCGFPTLHSFFSSRLARSPRGLKATFYSAYLKARTEPTFSDSHDVLSKVYVLCRWTSREPELASRCIKNGVFDLEQCSSFRIQYETDYDCTPVCGFLSQLSDLQKPLFKPVSYEPMLRENLLDIAQFDDCVLSLSDVFPMFPINSVWTKVAIALLEDENFTVFSVKAIIDHMRRVMESGTVRFDIVKEMKLFPKCAELHQHTTIAFAATQCVSMIKQNFHGDTNSRLLFLNQNPVHAREMKELQSDALKFYCKGMVSRLLKSFLVDKFMEGGSYPDIPTLVNWHKSTLRDYPYYRSLCRELDDGEILSLWQGIVSKPLSQHSTTVVDELIKESELSLQYLEFLTVEDVKKSIFGLCISAIIGLVFRRQISYFNTSDFAAVWRLVKPAFRDFKKASAELQLLDSAGVGELRTHAERLETAICLAFSITMHFPQSTHLAFRLSRASSVDVSEGSSDFHEVLSYLRRLSPSDLWQAQTVLRSADTRLSCTFIKDKCHLAVATVRRELK